MHLVQPYTGFCFGWMAGAGGGTVAGNNTQPQHVTVTDCVMQNLGSILVHVVSSM